MAYRFRHHYTREEARQLLPMVQGWLQAMDQARDELDRAIPGLENLLDSGCSVGGTLVKRYLEAFAHYRALLREFSKREIFIKDLDRGLIDFPAFVAGREVFLCWERGEKDIEHWHDLDAGYSGREHIGD